MHYGNAFLFFGVVGMDATLNVRMSTTLKERGDKVLRQNGISTSMAVRALWQELASTRELPAFLREASSNAQEVASRKRALESLAGIAQGSLTNCTDDELDALGMARYE